MEAEIRARQDEVRALQAQAQEAEDAGNNLGVARLRRRIAHHSDRIQELQAAAANADRAIMQNRQQQEANARRQREFRARRAAEAAAAAAGAAAAAAAEAQAAEAEAAAAAAAAAEAEFVDQHRECLEWLSNKKLWTCPEANCGRSLTCGRSLAKHLQAVHNFRPRAITRRILRVKRIVKRRRQEE